MDKQIIYEERDGNGKLERFINLDNIKSIEKYTISDLSHQKHGSIFFDEIKWHYGTYIGRRDNAFKNICELMNIKENK